MKALVVYESLFGNTAAIGEAIAGSLRRHGIDAAARPVTRTSGGTMDDTDLLIVGGPTHAHGMSRASTRKTGATDPKNTYAEPTVEPGLREWFAGLPAGDGRAAAAFDTRIDKPVWVTGSAAKGIAKRLERSGFRLMAEPESFLVTTANTLEDGEQEHAAKWAAGLAGRLVGSEVGGR
ncbi:MAG TPA: flavodoxin [Actinomycetota bacterium]|nr:flavodoxin [Actinomycetota bacterium]